MNEKKRKLKKRRVVGTICRAFGDVNYRAMPDTRPFRGTGHQAMAKIGCRDLEVCQRKQTLYAGTEDDDDLFIWWQEEGRSANLLSSRTRHILQNDIGTLTPG
jgi:hypothetical protein